MVRAKFKVQRIEATQQQRPGVKTPEDPNGWKNPETIEIRTVVLAPVYSDDPASENKRFWDASPSGEIKLGTVNPEAWAIFELGGEYYIDFSPAPKA